MRFTPRKSSPRMPSFGYAGSYAYHLIICTNHSRSWFSDDTVGRDCIAYLENSAAKYDFDLLAYCFMPDHVHMLVLGGERSLLVRFIQHFKQATGYRYRGMWQRSFYDRVLRREESMSDVTDYIWGNPLQAGLVDDAVEYPYSGPRDRLVNETEGYRSGVV